MIHYPNQLLIAGNTKYQWPKKRTKDDSYQMIFHIRGVEVLRRRRKRKRPCNEAWEDHDDYIKKHHTADLRCGLPYLDSTGDVPLCSTKEQMKQMFHHRGDYYGIDPPCREMKTIRTSYHESTFHIGDAPWVRKGTFWMGIIYPYEDFKEILQTRYYQRIRFRI